MSNFVIGDQSSSEEESEHKSSKYPERISVKESKNFFERQSRGTERDETPDFKRYKNEEVKSAVEKVGKPVSGGTKLKNLFQTHKSTKKNSITKSEKKRINIFSAK